MNTDILAALHWRKLRDSRASETTLGIPSVELDVITANGNARLALGNEGEPRLLLPVNHHDQMPDIGKGAGLRLDDSTFKIKRETVRFIDFVCTDPELEKVFGDVVNEVLTRVSDGLHPSMAVQNVIVEFRDLLKKQRTDAPQQEIIIGLIGELWFLNQLLEQSASSWQAWQGPSGGRHDFLAGNMAIELKAALRKQQQVIEINAIDQLQEPANGDLFLIYIELEENASGELSVPVLFDKALKLSDDPDALKAQVAKLGYDHDDPDEWESLICSLKVVGHYRVDENFPRLILSDFHGDNMPHGISHFRYRVDLLAAMPSMLSPAETAELPGKFIACLN